MDNSTNEWELSKENIQPIQQGRKPNVLKAALVAQIEDAISQQRKNFEQELRTYSGDDPLSVWCRYIKWVEQNFPKGGKEGHIEKLIVQCLSVLKDEKKYFNDKRFVDAWLKLANISIKPVEIYNYMYSNNIGCKSSDFYIAWAWELEQLSNWKKADEVFTEGINRNAEPLDKLKSARSEFENRMTTHVINSGQKNESEEQRSAFSLLRPQNRRHEAPISRVGTSVMQSNRESRTLGHCQPQPKSTVNSKLPFKIFNSNAVPSLPVQSENVVPYVLHSDARKENEKTAGKWNKVKLPKSSITDSSRASSDLKFTFHQDESPQPLMTPKSASKTSSVLSSRKTPQSPPMALFESPDPMKQAMYDKNKIYGGTEEFSFEEIRAAKWFENQKRIKEEEWILEKKALKNKVKALEEQIQQLNLHSNLKTDNSISSPMGMTQSSALLTPMEQPLGIQAYKDAQNSLVLNTKRDDQCSIVFKEPQALSTVEKDNEEQKILQSKTAQDSSTYVLPNNAKNFVFSDVNNKNYQGSNSGKKLSCNSTVKNLQSLQNASIFDNLDILEQRCSSTSYSEAANMVQELYNGTFTKSNEDVEFLIPKEHLKPNNVSISVNMQKHNTAVACPDSISKPYVNKVLSHDHQNLDVENFEEIKKNDFLFSFYHDPTDTIPKYPLSHKNVGSEVNKNANQDLTHLSIINPCLSNEEVDENIENRPPFDYVQEPLNRELAGILVPSKNIPFVPLEDQKSDEDDDDGQEDYFQRPDQAMFDENTVNYTRQFATARFLASTPCVKKKQISDVSDQDKHSDHVLEYALMPPPSIINQPSKKLDMSAIAKVETSSTRECGKVLPELKIKYVNNHVSLAVPANRLSIIMESSGECYSKSSSSSCSSTCSTKLGFSQSSHHQSISHKQVNETDYLSAGSKFSKNVSHCNLSSNKEPAVSPLHCETENQLSSSYSSLNVLCLEQSPFDSVFTQQLLNSLINPIKDYKNLYSFKKIIPNLKVGTNLNIEDRLYAIEKVIAEGSYAKVYAARVYSKYLSDFKLSELQVVALKVCKNSNEWEFYICSELQERLSKLKTSPDVNLSIVEITSAINYTNGIILVSEYFDRGTLLDIINVYKKQGSSVPENIIMYFALEMLLMVSKIHECKIIHADIKPDNFLLTKTAFQNVDEILTDLLVKTSSLCLIDFGRAIDLNFFKPDVCFNTVVTTDKFMCNEMKENKAWVYQPDWYGVLGCIHVLLFSDYMEVKKNSNGFWEPVQRFKRYWQVDLWQPLFHALMNIPSCYNEPDLNPFLNLIASKLQKNSNNFITQVAQLENLLLN